MVVKLQRIFPNNETVAIGEFIGPPVEGERFKIGRYETSKVEEVIDENRFRTYNSLYRIDFHDDYI